MPVNFTQNIKFKNVPEQQVDEFDFNGGLITDKHETKLEQNQSPDLANIIFNQTGSIKTRNGYLRYNNNPIGVSSDQSNTGSSTGHISLINPGDYVAQTFQASGAISCVQTDLYLAMNDSSQEQYVRAELWATSGGAPTQLIDNGEGQIQLVSGASETAYNFRYIVPASFSASTTYALIAKPFIKGSIQAINQVNVYYTGSAYGSGQVLTSSDSGLTWSADSSKDLRFVVYAGGDTACTGLIRYYNSTGTQQLINKIGASLYIGNDSTGVMTAITFASGVNLNTANFLDYTITNDTLLVVDKSNRIKKYRGSTNSNYSTGTISVTNNSATITGSGTSWNTTTNAQVGEYIQLPDTKWYMIKTISSDTSLTIETTYQGSPLSSQSYIISPWGEVQGRLASASSPSNLIVPQPDYIESHLNRIWSLDGNNLRFSVLDTSVTEENFNDWDSSNNAGSIIIPGGEGDTGTGLYSLNGYLYVFQRHAIWELFGSSIQNFELRNISTEIGMIDKRTLVQNDRYLVFFSGKDIYIFDGTNLTNITDGRINKLIKSWANITSPCAVLWNNNYLLSFTPSGETVNSQAVLYDFSKDIFGKMENIYANTWVVWNGGNDTGQVYFGSSNQGSVYHWDLGGNDDGYEITTRYNTPSLGYGGNMNDKSIKKFFIQQLALGDWNMDVSQFSDINSDTITSGINLSGGSTSLWDTMVWDTDTWSDEGSLITTRIAEFQGLAKYFKFQLQQSGYNEGIEALGITTTSRVRRLQ